jgi:predicted dehydrogenase
VAFEDATAQFTFLPDAGRHAETLTLYGPGYAVRIDVAGGQVSLAEGGETVREWGLPDDTPGYVRSGALDETRAFLDAVRAGTPRGPTVADAVESLALATAIDGGDERGFESADRGEGF